MSGRKKERVRIQDPNEDEREAQNVNHIQHFLTSSPKEPRINVVTTRSPNPMKPCPILHENNSKLSNCKLRDDMNEHDPKIN